MDAVTIVPEPENEPVRTYAPGTSERASLLARLGELRAEHVDAYSTVRRQHLHAKMVNNHHS